MKMNSIKIKIYNSPEETARAFAGFLADDINACKGLYFIALSGGSTPKILYRILVDEFKNKIDWQKVQFFWGDDRMVPVSSPESNYGEAKRILLDNISVPTENIHPIDGLMPPEIEAERYSQKILELLPLKNGLPVFNLMLQGMGNDGHTASIFPNQMQLLNSNKICEPAWHPETKQPRVTLTGRVINNSKKVAFLVNGSDKAEKISEILNKKGLYPDYPSSHILPVNSELYWFLDNEAAKQINHN
jgi:6-phosphogluconolactonase